MGDCVIKPITSHILEIRLFTKQYFKNMRHKRVNNLTALLNDYIPLAYDSMASNDDPPRIMSRIVFDDPPSRRRIMRRIVLGENPKRNLLIRGLMEYAKHIAHYI